MISETNKALRERFALGQISTKINEIVLNNNQKQDSTKKVSNTKVDFNENQMERLKSLKSKYKKFIANQNSQPYPSNAQQKQIDTSFRRIEIFGTDDSKLTKKFKSSVYDGDFEKKIQESSSRVESNIERVEDKLKTLKGMYQNQNSTRKNENSFCETKNFSQKRDSQRKTVDEKQNTRLQDSSVKRSYAQQLKSINFIDEIKRKIMEIENQKKINLEKKASETSRISKVFTEKFEQKLLQKDNQQKMTLAKLTPNLAESEVIDTTFRERLGQKANVKRPSESDSLIVQNYKFFPNIDTSRIKYDKIMEDPQNEDMLIRASPIHTKSPYIETTNLQETHLIERNSLHGDLQIIQKDIERQFVLLINRLAYQAEIDNRFSCEIFKYDNIIIQKQSLKSIVLAKLKQHYQQNSLPFNQKMFEVSQMQLDPLATVNKILKDYTPDEIMKVGFGLKKLYDKNCYYFEKKLMGSFSFRTIQFLFEELQKCHSLKENEALNVGHLTSYINMRTGKNLRNRYFYRLLKRIVRDPTKIGSTFRKQDFFQTFVKN